ncbi:hypothetical protein U1Q18_052380 [Sarracenia purpurea var. burkii]
MLFNSTKNKLFLVENVVHFFGGKNIFHPTILLPVTITTDHLSLLLPLPSLLLPSPLPTTTATNPAPPSPVTSIVVAITTPPPSLLATPLRLTTLSRPPTKHRYYHFPPLPHLLLPSPLTPLLSSPPMLIC